MDLITDTFVLVAPDCPAAAGVAPKPRAAGPTVAVLQHELLTARPYKLTLEELYVEVLARRTGRTDAQGRAAVRAELAAKPQACMRASPLPKQYGWGVHYDGRGRLALHAVESAEYRRFAAGAVAGVAVVAAMRSKRG